MSFEHASTMEGGNISHTAKRNPPKKAGEHVARKPPSTPKTIKQHDDRLTAWIVQQTELRRKRAQEATPKWLRSAAVRRGTCTREEANASDSTTPSTDAARGVVATSDHSATGLKDASAPTPASNISPDPISPNPTSAEAATFKSALLKDEEEAKILSTPTEEAEEDEFEDWEEVPKRTGSSENGGLLTPRQNTIRRSGERVWHFVMGN